MLSESGEMMASARHGDVEVDPKLPPEHCCVVHLDAAPTCQPPLTRAFASSSSTRPLHHLVDWYGRQADTAAPSELATAMLECPPSATTAARQLSINRWVTSGVTPAGRPSAFHSLALQQKANAALEQSQIGSYAARESSERASYATISLEAATLAVTIRWTQRFHDGNHRTGLASAFILIHERGFALPSLTSNDLLKLYAILSMREGSVDTVPQRKQALDQMANLLRRHLRKTTYDSDEARRAALYDKLCLVRALPTGAAIVTELHRLLELGLRHHSRSEEARELAKVVKRELPGWSHVLSLFFASKLAM